MYQNLTSENAKNILLNPIKLAKYIHSRDENDVEELGDGVGLHTHTHLDFDKNGDPVTTFDGSAVDEKGRYIPNDSRPILDKRGKFVKGVNWHRNDKPRQFTQKNNTVTSFLESGVTHPRDKVRCRFCASVVSRGQMTSHRRSKKHKQAVHTIDAIMQAQVVSNGMKFCLVPNEASLEDNLVKRIRKRLIQDLSSGKLVINFD